MSEILSHVTMEENRIFAGACLTYSGVPFHRVEKNRTGPDDVRSLDEMFDRLIEERRQLRPRGESGSDAPETSKRSAKAEVEFSEAEIDLLIEVLEAVLREHVGFDYDLELHVAPREEVEAALTKLQGLRRPRGQLS